MTTDARTDETTRPEHGGLLRSRYRWATIGSVGLVFLAAFESLAVTTVMPTASAELDGRSLFAVAFSATLAAGVVGMVAAGLWTDRQGPAPTLVAAVGLFAAGLVVAGAAPSMEILVAGRLLQGLGGGALSVSLYVLVSQVYDAADHPRIFGAFAAAWVLPSIVGPSLAGLVTQTLGWRWVFLGVVVLAAVAFASVTPAMRASRAVPEPGDGAPRWSRLTWAAAAAGAVVALDLGARAGGVPGTATVLVSLVVVVVALRALLPTGTLVARRGLPAAIALRGLASAAFLASEIYLPFLLQARHGVDPALAGVTLTTAALGWASASWLQGRFGEDVAHARVLAVGAPILAAGVGATLLVVALDGTWLMALTWAVAGVGMGLMYPRLTSLVLAASAPADRGAHTSALTLGDSVGGATAIGGTGLVFAAAGTAPALAPFVAALALTTVVALLAVVVSRRLVA